MSWWSKLWGTDSEPVEHEKPDPRRSGSVILLVGAPRSGKTMKGMRMCLRAGFEYRLPVVLQDTNGDLEVYRDSVVDALAKRSDRRSQLKADYIRNKVVIETDTKKLIGRFDAYRLKARRNKDHRKPEAFFFIDEAGIIRREDNDGESFWNIATSFGNAGITCYTTAHKNTDVARVGRQTIRAVCFERNVEGESEWFGETIKPEDSAPPMSDWLVYMDGLDRKIKRWKMPSIHDPIVDIPSEHEILFLPVQPTRVETLVI